MTNDEELNYKELTNLCRKQEERIKELEGKIEGMTPSDSERCFMPSKPTYEELEHDIENLTNQLRHNDRLVFALEKSLVKINDEAMNYKQEADWYKQENYKLRKELNNEKC